MKAHDLIHQPTNEHSPLLSNLVIMTIAMGEFGVAEWPGNKHNPEVMKYFHQTGREWVDSDELNWCDAYVDWVVMKAGGQITPNLIAREWLREGVPVTKPFPGDIVILWRESIDSWKGHVGFFVRQNDSMVWLLGGNQSNQVQILPFRKERILETHRIIIPNEKLNLQLIAA